MKPASIDCRDCKHYCEAMVFELCGHPSSEYKIAEKVDFHSIGHMRQFACKDGVLFEARVL
jgi:hypothetical protein